MQMNLGPILHAMRINATDWSRRSEYESANRGGRQESEDQAFHPIACQL
jgi:hypothetical protein